MDPVPKKSSIPLQEANSRSSVMDAILFVARLSFFLQESFQKKNLLTHEMRDNLTERFAAILALDVEKPFKAQELLFIVQEICPHLELKWNRQLQVIFLREMLSYLNPT